MKKNNVKAFTLVEMLIVIVIIGILIASLMPRMQSAQGRARDVARKNDLAQIQTAIITSQQDRGEYPKVDSGATSGLNVSDISTELSRAGMSSIPADPNKANVLYGLGDKKSASSAFSGGQYGYMVATRNSIAKGGFILMAKTEVEGGSNWVVCSGSDNLAGAEGLKKGLIDSSIDLKDVHTCTSFTYEPNSTTNLCRATSGDDGVCVYNDINELRYILLY